MIDKLKLRSTQDISREIFFKHFPTDRYSITCKRDLYYKEIYVANEGTKNLLTIKVNPSFSNAPASQLIVNPNKWDSFGELCEVISRVADLDKLFISRIDHNIDLNMPIDYIYSGLRVKYKQDVLKYYESEQYKRGRLTGFYIGKEPEIYCIYDKAYQLKGKKLFKRKGHDETKFQTRIEIRQTKNKIKFNKFLDLDSYLKNPPFCNIEFYEVNHSKIKNKDKQFIEELNQKGMNLTSQIRNKNGNFKRDYCKYLTQVNLADIAGELYREELGQFLSS